VRRYLAGVPCVNLGNLIQMMILRASRRRAPGIIAVLLLIVGVGLLIGYAGRDTIEEIVVSAAERGTPMAAPVAASPAERSFYSYVGARLRALNAESAELARLGDERSRNLMELQVRSDRVIELADQIDAYIAATGVPPRFSLAVEKYQSGILDVRTGIDDAKSAVLRLDWDAVAVALDLFENGTNQLDATYRLMRDIVSGGTAVAA
jgi:hypothetical protein